MNGLLQIYPIVLVPILSEWINDEDLCCVDTAVCNQELRNSFLSVVAKCNLINLNILHSKEGNRNDWCRLRHIKRKKFLCNYSNVDEIIDMTGTGHLLYLRIEDHEVMASKLLQSITADVHLRCPTIATMKLIGHKITQITLRSADENKLDQIALLCPNLKGVELLSSFCILPLVDNCHLESILNCHLESLVNRENLPGNYSCDFREHQHLIRKQCVWEKKSIIT